MFDNTYPENVPEIFKLADEQVKGEDEEEIVYRATLGTIVTATSPTPTIDYITIMNKAASKAVKKAEKKQRKKEAKARKKAQREQYKELVAKEIERRRKMFHILTVIKPNKPTVRENDISVEEMRSVIIQYKTRVKMLRKKIASLNISKKKDAKKLAEYNIEIKSLEEQIHTIEEQTGIHETVETATGFKRVVINAMEGIRKKAKHFKKFVKKNKELVAGILAIAIPSILTMIVKSSAS